MNNKRDPTSLAGARRGAWSDKASSSIFFAFVAVIIVASLAYFFGANDVEINPGKNAVDTTTTQSAPVTDKKH